MSREAPPRVPARIDVFGAARIPVGYCSRTRVVGAAWQAWNPGRRMERAMARLPGSGSFYWPTARDAYRRALVILRDPAVEACRVSTVSGREIAYLRGNSPA